MITCTAQFLRMQGVDYVPLPHTPSIMTILLTLRRTALLAVILLFGSVAYAQQADAIERLTQRLDLTQSQVELVRSHLTAEHSPEAIWRLSTALASTLTDAQQARLNETAQRPERQAREARLSADRPQRQAREAQREGRETRLRTERPRMEREHNRQTLQQEELSSERQAASRERREAHQAARNRALNLSAEQIRQLDEARTERSRTSMQDILTEEQAQIWKLHSLLSRTLR